MKGLKRLFLVCMLMICVVFSLTACDKSSNTNDIKVGNEVHAEESAPPIEYWLDKGTGLKFHRPNNSPNVNADSTSHVALKASKVLFSTLVKNDLKKLNKLNVWRLDSQASFYWMVLETKISAHWVDQNLQMDCFFYKNGKFESKSPHNFKAVSSKKEPRPRLMIFPFDKKPNGLYVFFIHEASSIIYFGGHGQFPEKIDLVKNNFFAVQIGNDDFCDNFKG